MQHQSVYTPESTFDYEATLTDQQIEMLQELAICRLRHRRIKEDTMNYTQEQIDRANAVSLEDFLRSQGETLIKMRTMVPLERITTVLTVRGNRWFRPARTWAAIQWILSWSFTAQVLSEENQMLTRECGEGQAKVPAAPLKFHPFAQRTADRAIQYLCENPRAQQKRLLRLFFFPGIFTRTRKGTMLCLSAETEAAHRDTPMCENGRYFQTGHCRVSTSPRSVPL